LYKIPATYWGRELRRRCHRFLIKFAASRVVTPLAGFILSDFYLSNEVDSRDLTFLNRRSRRLNGSQNPVTGGIVYVQVDQIDEFAERYLPVMARDFVLVTSKWHLPGLAKTRAVQEILRSPHFLIWYSTNQVFPALGIRPFPFGISHEAAWQVWRRMVLPRLARRRSGILIPHATQHPHLSGRPLAIRKSLAPMMEPQVPLPSYLAALGRSLYVISPPGDRPDTYRHWEVLAMGATPVCVSEPFLQDLLGRHAVFCDDLLDACQGRIELGKTRPAPSLATLAYWKARIKRETRQVLRARKMSRLRDHH